MDENSNLIDEMVNDSERAPGDTQKAWRLLAAHIDGTDLPSWVKAYVKKSAAVVSDFDKENGDQAMLAHNLGFYQETDANPGGNYDLDEIFEWFTDRMMKDVSEGKKINVSRTAREYREETRRFDSQPDGIRKAYEKARVRHARQLEAGAQLERLLAERGVPPST